MQTIKFVDTTIRDGHQSLWAENMTTGMMLPIAKNLDDAGFEGIDGRFAPGDPDSLLDPLDDLASRDLRRCGD